MAYAETQSMFCDSLLGDADWLKAYAKDKNGQAVPDQVRRRGRAQAVAPAPPGGDLPTSPHISL